MNENKVRLMLNVTRKSKAKFLKLFPLKSFIEGEEYEISFRLENIGEIDFPGGMLRFSTKWPSLQEVRQSTPIKPLKRERIVTI